MGDALAQVVQRIEQMEKQRRDISIQTHSKKKFLAAKMSQQQELIMRNEDTSEIVAEIVSTQTEIQGMLRTIDLLGEELAAARKEETIERRKAAIEENKILAAEVMDSTKAVYIALADLTTKIIALKRKHRELTKKMAGLPTISGVQKISQLREAIEQKLPKIFDSFPKEIFKDESLPDYKALISDLLQ